MNFKNINKTESKIKELENYDKCIPLIKKTYWAFLFFIFCVLTNLFAKQKHKKEKIPELKSSQSFSGLPKSSISIVFCSFPGRTEY